MKWLLIVFLFHGNGAPVAYEHEFNMLSDCMAAYSMVRSEAGKVPAAIVVGGCTQRM